MKAKVVFSGGNSRVVSIDIFAHNAELHIDETFYARTQYVNRVGAAKSTKSSLPCRQLVANRHGHLRRAVVTDKSSQGL